MRLYCVLCSYTVNEKRLFTGKYKHNIKGRCKYAITYIYYIYLLNHSNNKTNNYVPSHEDGGESHQNAGASSFVNKDSRKEVPVMMLVVATMYSTLDSSCWLRNLRAATSAMVAPPTKKTRMVFF